MAGVKIKTINAQKLAYLEHTGDYSSIPYGQYFDKLYAWAKEKKVRPGFKPLGIFHDNPEKTPPEQCRSEIAIPIIGDAESDEEIKVKELPEMEVAVIKHKGSSEEYQNTYKTLGEWIIQNGYEWAGPCMEVYTKKPKVKGEQTIMYATIQAPVKKKEPLLRKLADKEESTESKTEESEDEPKDEE
ncbi:MAG: GyrI-like domain-containing protein [Thermoplasmata archaeon]|nr:MAG: GyrI-like domain-containing protein [Thermoplasmata archaeon]